MLDCPPVNRSWMTSSQTDSFLFFFVQKMVAKVNYTCGKHGQSGFNQQLGTGRHHVWK